MSVQHYALILGASSGFGKATALKLASQGFGIFGVHLDRAAGMKNVEELKQSLTDLNVPYTFWNVNAVDPAQRVQIVAEISDQFSQNPESTIRLLMHSLAFGTLKPFVAADPSQALTQKNIEMTMDVMANSLIYWTQDVVRAGLMKPGGRVLGLTSAGSTRVLPSYGAVSAAKAALESYCRQLSLELTPYGITANTIRAGVTHTPALEKIPGNDIIMANALMRNPNHRLTRPEDVARVISMLVRDEAQWMNGNVIGVDGGEDAVDLTWWKPESGS